MIDHDRSWYIMKCRFNNHRDRSQSIMMYPDVKNTNERGVQCWGPNYYCSLACVREEGAGGKMLKEALSIDPPNRASSYNKIPSRAAGSSKHGQWHDVACHRPMGSSGHWTCFLIDFDVLNRDIFDGFPYASRDSLPLGSTVVLCAVYHNITCWTAVLIHSILQ